MRSYESYPSSDRLRQASLIVIALSGATVGLLGGGGWRLFREGSQQLAMTLWVVAFVTVAILLFLALVTRVLAHLVDRDEATRERPYRGLEERVMQLEQELSELRSRT